jgi:hypothetical protein
MPTSVHLPKKLLAAVDRRARELKISRNRLIILALEKELAAREWSPGFLEHLRTPDADLAQAVDEMTAAIRAHRSGSKPPPKL